VSDVPSAIKERVARVVRESGAALPPEAEPAFGAWIALLASSSERLDLTAATSDDELVDGMLGDALALAAKVRPNARLIDVGTGAGAPGLPLAVARPDLEVTLVEPLQKRVALLRTMVGALPGRVRPSVVRGRGEEIADRGARFEVAISRGVLAPAAWLELGGRLAPLGEVWVLLGREAAPERDGWKVTEEVSYRWALTRVERRALRFEAVGKG
jgi:16S rRNA (guanine527-N7)-methyltransferase